MQDIADVDVDENRDDGEKNNETESEVDSADVADEMDEMSTGNDGRISVGGGAGPQSPAYVSKHALNSPGMQIND